jgi:pimeloyl-ACP methyl ester carboxylesterase
MKTSTKAVVCAVAVLASACSSAAKAPTASPSTTPGSSPDSSLSSAGSAAPSGTSSVQWSSCQGGAGPAGYQCASVAVPRDPQHPAAGTIELAIDRRPASGHKIGSLLVNPGGPGASGVDLLPDLITSMPSSLLARFDIVGFDPPGVARTAPITCLDSAGLARYFHLDPAPATTAGFDALVAEDKTFAAGCEARSGAELPYVGTVDAAMDLDVLRQALGDAKLNYLGFSYGTFLGAEYAELYPTHIRALVLDGALDPALPVITQLDQQSASLDGELRQFFASCASDSKCPWRPVGDPATAFANLLARVRTSPLPAQDTSRTVGPSELLYGTAAALYSTATWRDLEYGLAQASSGDGTTLLELFDAYTGRNRDGSYSNLFEANAAINCLDAPAPNLAQILAAAPAAQSLAPIFGVQDLYSEAGCSVWPVAATGQVGPIHATGSPPIVVVGSTGDPITPYTWAQALASQLQRGVLLTRVGSGHTAYRSSPCIRTAVDKYLIDLTPPAAGTTCPSNS